MRKEKLKRLIYPQNQGFILVFLLSLCISACDKKAELTGFDSVAWKKDFDACTNVRLKMAPSVVKQQKKLIGKHENTITQLLGHPNRLDLGKKMTRTAYYTIENKNCKKEEAQQVMVIDFNSLSQVRLIIIQRE